MNEELEALKRNWVQDPCWDIEDTEGFEDYYEELLAFRLDMEQQWEQKKRERLTNLARQIGWGDNTEIAQDFDKNIRSARYWKKNAQEALAFYLKAEGEQINDINYLVECLLNAAVILARNEILKHEAPNPDEVNWEL